MNRKEKIRLLNGLKSGQISLSGFKSRVKDYRGIFYILFQEIAYGVYADRDGRLFETGIYPGPGQLFIKCPPVFNPDGSRCIPLLPRSEKEVELDWDPDQQIQ